MTDEAKIEDVVARLYRDALFGCQNDSCASDVSYSVDCLRMFRDEPICQACYDENYGIEEDEKTAKDWSDLPKFDPIAPLLAHIERPGSGGEAPFWVIERANNPRQVGLPDGDPLYCKMAGYRDWTDWTPSIHEALKWPSRSEAETFWRHHEASDPALKIREHMYVSALSPSPKEEGTRERKKGDLVRFYSQREGGPVHRVVSVMQDGMIELHDMVGYFAPHLFVVADDIADIPPTASLPPDRSKEGAAIEKRLREAHDNFSRLDGVSNDDLFAVLQAANALSRRPKEGAGERRVEMRDEWFLDGLRYPPGVYLIIRESAEVSDEIAF